MPSVIEGYEGVCVMKLAKNLFWILIFSAILFLSRGLTVALITYFFGAPSFEGWNPFRLLLVINGPACLISIVVFYFLAKKILGRPYIHAFFVLVIAELLDLFATLLITKQLLYSPAWALDFSISLFSLFVGTLLGVKSNWLQKEHELLVDRIKGRGRL
jgi:hypothetical protein